MCDCDIYCTPHTQALLDEGVPIQMTISVFVCYYSGRNILANYGGGIYSIQLTVILSNIDMQQ